MYWMMTGVIWVVQILLYPNFKLIGPNELSIIHQLHIKKNTY